MGKNVSSTILAYFIGYIETCFCVDISLQIWYIASKY